MTNELKIISSDSKKCKQIGLFWEAGGFYYMQPKLKKIEGKWHIQGQNI